MSVFHAEAARNNAQRAETHTFVKAAGVGIGGDGGVELYDSESMQFCLGDTIPDQFFADVEAAEPCADGKACIADVSAAANIVGMEDIQAIDFPGSGVCGNGVIGLSGEKLPGRFWGQGVFLGEGNAALGGFVPNFNHVWQVVFLVRADLNIHGFLPNFGFIYYSTPEPPIQVYCYFNKFKFLLGSLQFALQFIYFFMGCGKFINAGLGWRKSKSG